MLLPRPAGALDKLVRNSDGTWTKTQARRRSSVIRPWTGRPSDTPSVGFLPGSFGRFASEFGVRVPFCVPVKNGVSYCHNWFSIWGRYDRDDRDAKVRYVSFSGTGDIGVGDGSKQQAGERETGERLWKR